MPQAASIIKIGQFHEDDRAQRLLDIIPLGAGQLNISYVNSIEHVVAWHAHILQTDFWVCLKGSLKVGLATPIESCECSNGELDPDLFDVRFEYLSDKNFCVLAIPPGIYHGYRALEPGTILLYYLTHRYDPADEFRAPVGVFSEEWNTQNK